VSDKTLVLYGLLFVVIMACAMFIAYRLQRLKAQREEAEKRAVVAFEQMNLLTKSLRETASKTPASSSQAPGERLQQMYPGPKRPAGGPSGG
jgi:hypothetical protein